MNEQRKICAMRLFDAIGEIEDRYIAEAETAYTPKKPTGILTKLLPIALCLTLFIGAYAAFMIGNMAQKGDNMATEDAENAPSADIGDADAAEDGLMAGTTATSKSSLGARLLRVRDRADLLCPDGMLPSLTDGTPRLIWNYTNDEAYRAVVLSAEQVTELTDEMKTNSATSLTAPDSVTVRLWIVTADGTVMTPYLPWVESDFHIGELFDFEPKIEPSAELSDRIEQILTPEP